jgi:ketosteroid isomerase-like protein
MTTRRSLIATGAAGAAFGPTAARAEIHLASTVAMLAARAETANGALMRGDVGTYRAQMPLDPDFVLMSPFGGTPSRPAALSDAEWEGIGRFFAQGTLRQDVVETYAVPGMVVLVLIEHNHGEVGGLPAQAWPLRVTLVFRQDGEEWLLAHRHADPLARGITLAEAAALAA